MKEQLKEIKKSGSGSVTVEEYTVKYNSEKETEKIATFGPWSIEGSTKNVPDSGIKALGCILDSIREIEYEN